MKLTKLVAIAALMLTAPTFAGDSLVPVSKQTKDISISLRDKAMETNSTCEILKSLSTEVGARHPGTPGEKTDIE